MRLVLGETMKRRGPLAFALALCLIAGGMTTWWRLCEAGPAVSAEGIDRVAITGRIVGGGPAGRRGGQPIVVVDPATVARLVQAVKGAKRDRTLYDCIKDTTIAFHRGQSVAVRIRSTDGLFDLDGKQYRDGSGVLSRLVRGMLAADAALVTAAEARPKPQKTGEDVSITLTVRNAGPTAVTLPGRARLKGTWAKGVPADPRAWQSSSTMAFHAATGEGDPAPLRPGRSREYAVRIPTGRMGKGRTLISLSFLPSAEGTAKALTWPSLPDVVVDLE